MIAAILLAMISISTAEGTGVVDPASYFYNPAPYAAGLRNYYTYLGGSVPAIAPVAPVAPVAQYNNLVLPKTYPDNYFGYPGARTYSDNYYGYPGAASAAFTNPGTYGYSYGYGLPYTYFKK